MLQPRVSRVSRRSSTKIRARKTTTTCFWITLSESSKILFSLLVILLVLPHGFAQYTDKPFIVEPTPALRINEEDLTTVLLVNNDNARGDHVHGGRFVNVRPEVGLLKTTARTFIQEGVTTEYATQVLGTTLENGRLYAQLLKKSSRVLYEPSVVTSWVGEGLQTRSLLQSHNDLFNADQPDWQDIDDRLLLEKNAFVGSPDNIGFHELRFQKLSNKNRSAEAISNRTSTSVSTSTSSGFSSVSSEQNAPKDLARNVEIEKELRKISANKVLPFGDLPTYTVKNHFAPSGFSWESGSGSADVTLQQNREGVEQNAEELQRSPKHFYNQIMASEPQFRATDAVKAVRLAVKSLLPSRVLSTITYYGFADFTTLVGDSVIVFSPSSVMLNANHGHVTSIKGEATLGGIYGRVSDVKTTIMPELIKPTYVDQSTSVAATTTHVVDDMLAFGLEKHHVQEQNLANINENGQQTLTTSATITTTKAAAETTNGATDDSHNIDTTTPPLVAADAGRQDVIELETSEAVALNDTIAVAASKTITKEVQSATSSQPVLLSRPSNEEILRIYASLARAEAARQVVTTLTTMQTTQETTTMDTVPEKPSIKEVKVEKEDSIQKSDIKVLGGATTIFFEDDPFANFIEPTSTITKLAKSEESIVIGSSVAATATIISTESAVITTTPTTPTTDASNAEENVTTVSAVISEEHGNETTVTTVTTDMPVEFIETTENVAEEQSSTTPAVESTTSKLVAAVIVKEIEANEAIDTTNCKRTSQVFLTHLPKTLTYYTTYLIPDEQKTEQTITSIETNIVPTFDIGQATKHYCIQSTNVFDSPKETATVQLEKPLTQVNQVAHYTKAESTGENTTHQAQFPSTTPMIIVRQNQVVTEHVAETPQSLDEPKYVTTEATTIADDEFEENGYEEDEENGDDVEDDQEDDSEEDVDLIYKTLYTTYTYLTTFFHDDTTSISSHKEVITNVITSTNKPESDIEATKLTDLYSDNEIAPTTKFVVPTELASALHLEEDDYIEEQLSAPDKGYGVEATTYLDDSKLTKTYYTTYTYYTTIYAAGETEVMSRTEVFTNHVTDTLAATSTTTVNEDNTTTIQQIVVGKNAKELSNEEIKLKPTASLSAKLNGYSTVHRNREKSLHVPDLSNYSSVTLVTDVRSSSSNGDHQIINDGLEDQISSESNTDEIIPSATLLLQTSFTTFTYYTTMYSGENTNVVSRLETITNVATETLQPSKTVNIEEATLPITYFTTFTYWTKLSKDGQITTLSREETVSNVVTPTNVLLGIETTSSESEFLEIGAISTNDILAQPNAISTASFDAENTITSIAIATTVKEKVLFSPVEPTTFYTTYTYYTTSYVNDKTFTDSRFETVTNVVTPTVTASNEPTKPLATAADVQSSEEIVSAISIKPQFSSPEITQSIISYENKKVIDADGISTLYFTTQVIATTAEGGIHTEVTSSSSSLQVDEIKKALQPTSSAPEVNADGSTVRQYKTGLVRLIEGTRIANSTTTLYQSRVIGTVIDKRYAQIIESTSSFLIEKTKSPQLDTQFGISASATTVQALQSTQQPSLESITASPDSLEGSITESIENRTEENPEHGDENAEDEEVDGNKSPFRFAVQSKKRTFTPVIRPFVSRNRPQFAPKKKNVSASSATIITRSDFTPTITATPALKSSGRFSSSRRNGFSSGAGQLSEITSGLSSSRRFSRPNKPSAGSNQPFAGSAVPHASASGSFGGQRNRLTSSRISSSSSSRRSSSSSRASTFGGFRSGLSSAYAGNSRLRIKPTATLGIGQQTNSIDPFEADASGEEENSTQENISVDEEEESTTENSRRNQNPLLRFRRPLVSRPSGFTPATPERQSSSGNSPISQRRNPLSSRAKATTSTTTTTTTSRPRPRSFQRPAVATFQGRTRPQSNLFPPRGLFQQQQQQQVTQETDQKPEEKSKNDEDFTDGADADDDSEYEDEEEEEGEDETEDDGNRRRRSNKTKSLAINPLQSAIKVGKSQSKLPVTVKRLSRTKREADTSQQTRSSFRNRYRRPKPAAGNEEKVSEEETEPEVSLTTLASRPRIGVGSRFNSRHNFYHSTSTTTAAATTSNKNRAIRPTRPSSGRAQFTLREKDTTPSIKTGLTRPSSSNFRRPQITSSSRRTPTPSSSNRRLKSYSNNAAMENTSRSLASRSRHGTHSTTSRTRGSTVRGRSRSDFNNDPALPLFDGTITVTHVIPAEVTIPVINGKITEYKNVVTAKTSTEVLGPQQYTTLIGPNRQPTTTLIREDTSVNFAGATEITQFVLHESPTTTITFTPTTIRGRKTSFSHVIPSTVYSVENVISTTQPEIAANAPLANILLSQLLLGNIGLPTNPLLGALGGAVTQPAQLGAQPTPVTEFRTHTTTYVTTLFEGMSTVIPITFQGKKILTTIFDTSAETITATEFITDTIVTTPTQQPAQAAQVNSLLLQQLLLQQQQQQLQQQPLPILHAETQMPLLLADNLQELDTNNIRISNEAEELQELPTVDETQAHKSVRKKNRKSGKSNKRHKQPAEQKSSVITLYVSGRRPGEFSTILSTVPIGYDSTQHKRHAAVHRTTSIDSPEDYYAFDGSEIFSEYALPEVPMGDLLQDSTELNGKNILTQLDRNMLDLSSESTEQTQSLESIVGDVSLWYAKSTALYDSQQQIKTTSKAASTTLAASEEKSQNFLF